MAKLQCYSAYGGMPVYLQWMDCTCNLCISKTSDYYLVTSFHFCVNFGEKKNPQMHVLSIILSNFFCSDFKKHIKCKNINSILPL